MYTFLHACIIVHCCVFMGMDQRQTAETLFFRASVLSFSLPICQTHHLWQKICCLVSLHLAVTLATAAEVNCQLGEPTSAGCHGMYVAGLIHNIAHKNVEAKTSSCFFCDGFHQFL